MPSKRALFSPSQQRPLVEIGIPSPESNYKFTEECCECAYASPKYPQIRQEPDCDPISMESRMQSTTANQQAKEPELTVAHQENKRECSTVQHQRKKESTAGKRMCCNCKKSSCLKLYCECFSNKQFCGGCNCINCLNTEENSSQRNKAMQATLERNPGAFEPKIIQESQVRFKILHVLERTSAIWSPSYKRMPLQEVRMSEEIL
jgi:hypothetical protein